MVSPGILAQRTWLKIFFFWAFVIRRPPMLSIQLSNSLIEAFLEGRDAFFTDLRKVVMENFSVVFSVVFDRLGEDLFGSKVVKPDLLCKFSPVENVLMRDAVSRVISTDINPRVAMINHENHGKGNQCSLRCSSRDQDPSRLIDPDLKISLRHLSDRVILTI